MYRLLLFLLFVVFANQNGVAQIEEFSTAIGWNARTVSVATVTDSEKRQSCTVLTGADSVLVWLSNATSGDSLIRMGWSIVRGETFAGGFIKHREVYLYFENEEKTSLRVLRYNPATGLTDEHTIAFSLARQLLLEKICDGGRLIYLARERKSNIYKLHIFSNDSTFETLSVKPAEEDLELFELGGPTGRNIGDFAFIPDDLNVNPIEAKAHGKFYLRGDSLLLLIDKDPLWTFVFTFDFLNKSLSKKIIPHNPSSDFSSARSVKFNTYLYENNLYYACVTRDSMVVEVVRLSDSTTLRSARLSSKEEIPNRVSNIRLKEGKYRSERTKEETITTREFAKKILEKDIFIIAVKDENGNHQLSLGSYLASITGVGGSPGIGGASIPYTIEYNSSKSLTKKVFISYSSVKILIDPITGRDVKGEGFLNNFERLDNMSVDNDITPKLESIFQLKGTSYYVFYNPESQLFAFLKF